MEIRVNIIIDYLVIYIYEVVSSLWIPFLQKYVTYKRTWRS
jgi:hypothetical protein